MSNPEISVIIPHMNQEEFLEKCLSSLSSQSIKDVSVEIIVVDNGSSRLPDSVVKKFTGVRLEQQLIPGPGPARNKGVRASSGRILAFIDADCIADERWLAVIIDSLCGQSGTEIIGGDVRIPRANPNKATMLEAYESIYAYRQKEYNEKKQFSGTGNLAMTRKVFEQVGDFAGIDIAEDRDWGKRATRYGFNIQYVPEMIVYHPARSSLAQLYRKWDRQISHDYAELTKSPTAKIKWMVRSALIFGSPLLEIWNVFHSTRVSTLRERLLTIYVLCCVRTYRAAVMLRAIFTKSAKEKSKKWNRI